MYEFELYLEITYLGVFNSLIIPFKANFIEEPLIFCKVQHQIKIPIILEDKNFFIESEKLNRSLEILARACCNKEKIS